MKPKVIVLGSGSSRSMLTKTLQDLHDAGVIEVVYDNGVVSASCSTWYHELCFNESDCKGLKALPQTNPQKAFLAAMKDKQNKLDSKKSRR